MRSSYNTLMQSKYFNPAFNSAIFDGPVRIYFAQFHEALALKLYFLIQQKLTSEMAKAKELSKASGANILVMFYPTEDSFAMSFESGSKSSVFEIEKWHEDMVMGVRAPLAEENLDVIVEGLRLTMESWRPASIPAPVVALEL